MSKGVILFHSIHHALKAERLFKKRNIPVDMVPVPRELTADCGVCATIPGDQLDNALAMLGSHDIFYQSAHRKEGGSFLKV